MIKCNPKQVAVCKCAKRSATEVVMRLLHNTEQSKIGHMRAANFNI